MHYLDVDSGVRTTSKITSTAMSPSRPMPWGTSSRMRMQQLGSTATRRRGTRTRTARSAWSRRIPRTSTSCRPVRIVWRHRPHRPWRHRRLASTTRSTAAWTGSTASPVDAAWCQRHGGSALQVSCCMVHGSIGCSRIGRMEVVGELRVRRNISECSLKFAWQSCCYALVCRWLVSSNSQSTMSEKDRVGLGRTIFTHSVDILFIFTHLSFWSPSCFSSVDNFNHPTLPLLYIVCICSYYRNVS